MEARATLKYARISPRKVEIVLDLIRNQPADKAMAILKRIRPRAHGRAYHIYKRTSHVTLVLREAE